MHNPAPHDAVIGHMDPRNEARLHYEMFQPYPRWEEERRKGSLALSAIVCGLMILAAFNGAFLKNKIIEEILLCAFGVWVALFFAYLITAVVLGRKKAKLYAREYPRNAHWLR